ncbi:hypothetical protein A1sIIB106_00310 [Candidatus Planktophila lacus]|nr:hypothetical protein A1sIIB106_00310 [Candidatus Planktophila lacus]
MSTKTTFKRVALVTVAALSFGTMASVSPASAAGATVLTTVKVSDATVYGYVGETLTAKVSVTAVGATGGALSADDSITLTAAITSISGSAVAALTTTGATQSVDSVNADSSTGTSQLAVDKFRFVESTTAGILLSEGFAPSVKTSVNLSGLDTKTAFTAASLHFRPSTTGTYKITVTPSNRQAGGSVTHTAGVITFVVLSAGAATSDGALVTSRGTANGVAGAGNYNQVKVTGQSGATALGMRVVVTGSVIEAAAANGTLSTDKTTLTIPGVTSGAINQGLINVLTPTVGTVTVNTYRETAVGTYSATADSTVTITVRAAALTGTATTSTTYMAEGEATEPDEDTDAAVVALTTVPSISNTADLTAAVARIQVIQYDALEAVASSSKTLAVTAEVTGAGRVGSTADAVGATSVIAHPAGTSTTTQAATRDFYVFADGRSGEATITIKVGGVTTLTRKVAFFGAATQLKLKAATAAAPNPSKSYLAVGGTMTISVVPYDANNVKLSTVAVTATSETTTIATVVASATAGDVTVTGVAVGKTNITIKNSTLGTLVVPVEVTKSTGVAKLTLDKTSAQPGEKVTWTITATDVNGRPVADGTSIALFSSITANMSVTGLPTGSETLTGGISTGSFFAPTSGSGTLTITATQGTAHDTYIAGLKAATAAGTTYTAVKDVVEMSVVNAAVDAAAAAAEEATAAANDATDAALSAAEAAEAATAMAQEAVDAVAELSASVTKLISALRAQITTLTNLVVKIQKKVKA